MGRKTGSSGLKRSEADVLRSVRALLKARSILHFRMNTGAMETSKGGFVRFGFPGMADILAFVIREWRFDRASMYPSLPVWIELKSSSGKQSKEQKLFQQIVEREGHVYLLVRSASEVEDFLSGKKG